MNKIFIFLIFLLALHSLYSQELGNEVHFPVLPAPALVTNLLGERGERINEYLRSERNSAEALFIVGMYYAYSGWDVYGVVRNDRERRRFLEKARDKLEKSYKKRSSALVLAQLGGIYGGLAGHASFPAVVRLGRKSVDKLNRAVREEPNNPEIRLLRLRSFLFMPPRYYSLSREIKEDIEKVAEWAEGAEKTQVFLHKYYLKELRNEMLYRTGRFFIEELRAKDVGRSYWKRIDEDSQYMKKITNEG